MEQSGRKRDSTRVRGAHCILLQTIKIWGKNKKEKKNENSFGKQASEHIILINWMSVTHMAFVYHSDTHNTIQYIEQYGLYSIDRYAHASMFYDHQNIETGDRSSYFYWPISLRCVECVWMCVSVLFTIFCAFTLTLISYFPDHSQYLVLPWILWNCWAQKKNSRICIEMRTESCDKCDKSDKKSAHSCSIFEKPPQIG